MKNKRGGFAIVELWVLIAMVTLIASVVITRVNTSHQKSRDALIKSEVGQLRTLMEQNFTDFTTYENLQTPIWFNSASDCTTNMPAGAYQAQAIIICKSIVSHSSENFTGATGGILLMNTNKRLYNKYASIMAYLPYNDAFYCAGSNDTSSETTTRDVYNSVGWSGVGCFDDPALNP